MIPGRDQDLYGWAMGNAQLLREGKYQEADMRNIIEEMEILGRSNKRELTSRMGVLIAHLMKWFYQSDILAQHQKSWEGTIDRERLDLKDLMDENPSLKSFLSEATPKAYKYAKAILKEETTLTIKTLPSECPYTFEQLMDETFFPA